MGVYGELARSLSRGGEILSEAYFGKSKNIQAIETQLGIFRNKYKGANTYFGNYSENPELQKLNRLFEKAFGFHCFSINIIRQQLANAYTIPISVKWDTGNTFNPAKLKSLAVVDSTGLKYKKDNNLVVICNITAGIMFSDIYTDGEVLAIILHEIGHNFAEALDSGISLNSMILSYLIVLFTILDMIQGRINLNGLTNFNALDKLGIDIKKWIAENCKPIGAIAMIMSGFFGLIQDGLMNINYLLQSFVPSAILQQIPSKIMGMIIKPTAYRNEKIADRFATMYGYGPELSSALSKLETVGSGITIKQQMDEVPVIGFIFNLVPTFAKICITPFDEHPMWSERLEDQIRALEYELKKADLDSKMKKEIEFEVKQIRDLKKKIISGANDISDANSLNKAWFAMWSDGDIKHTLISDLNGRLDSNIDTLRI